MRSSGMGAYWVQRHAAVILLPKRYLGGECKIRSRDTGAC